MTNSEVAALTYSVTKFNLDNGAIEIVAGPFPTREAANVVRNGMRQQLPEDCKYDVHTYNSNTIARNGW